MFHVPKVSIYVTDIQFKVSDRQTELKALAYFGYTVYIVYRYEFN